MKKYLIFLLVLMLALNTGCTITIGNPASSKSSSKETSKKTSNDEEDTEETKEEKTTSKKKKKTMTVELDVPDGFEEVKNLDANELANWEDSEGCSILVSDLGAAESSADFEAITADELCDEFTKAYRESETYPDPYVETLSFEMGEIDGYSAIKYSCLVDIGAQLIQGIAVINADRLYQVTYTMYADGWDDGAIDRLNDKFGDSVDSIRIVEK